MEVSQGNHTLIERWAKSHALVMILATLSVYFAQQIAPLIVTGMLSFILLILINRRAWLRYGFLGGPANTVTSLRLVLIFVLMAASSIFSHALLAFLGVVTLLADGIDGYLARRFQTSSFFGGYYDMETDAYFVLSMSTVLYITGLTGGWILWIGLTRYVFVLIKSFIKEKKQIQTRSYLGQCIAVFLMASLLAGLLIPKTIYLPLIVLAGAMVLFSFVRELVWIIRANRTVYENA